MRFEEAVRNTAGLEQAYRPGLQAIRTADQRRLSCRQTRSFTGSIDLDGTLAAALPDDPRWDYGVGFHPDGSDEKVFWIEVHDANSHHVDEVLRKLAWLKAWLGSHAPRLDAFPREFVWIASRAVAISDTSPQRRRVAAKGLRFVGRHLQIT